MLLEVAFSTYDAVIFTWRPILTLAMQATMVIEKSISVYYTLIGKNLVTWRSKKQHVVSLSSAEGKYCVIIHGSVEILWVHSFLQEISFLVHGAMPMYYDHQTSIFLAINSTFHEHTKHIEIDCHIICHRVLEGFKTTPDIDSFHQLKGSLTRRLSAASYDFISHKLGLFDLYAPAGGECEYI